MMGLFVDPRVDSCRRRERVRRRQGLLRRRFHSPRIARPAVRANISAVTTEEPPQHGGSFAQCFDLFLHHLRIERGLSANTVDNYGLDLRAYLGFLHRRGVGQIGQVNELLVREHLAELGRGGLGARSLARHLSAIKTLHSATWWRRVTCRTIRRTTCDRPSSPAASRVWLSVPEVDALLENAPISRRPAGCGIGPCSS